MILIDNILIHAGTKIESLYKMWLGPHERPSVYLTYNMTEFNHCFPSSWLSRGPHICLTLKSLTGCYWIHNYQSVSEQPSLFLLIEAHDISNSQVNVWCFWHTMVRANHASHTESSKGCTLVYYKWIKSRNIALLNMIGCLITPVGRTNSLYYWKEPNIWLLNHMTGRYWSRRHNDYSVSWWPDAYL